MKYLFNICCVITAAFAVIFLNSCATPKADFSYFSYSSMVYFSYPVPCTIYFTNLSKNADSYDWDFGDGTASTETDPAHIYTTAGTYTVALTAYGGLA